jgi:hypothetical protein
MGEWHRGQLWAATDASRRRQTRLALSLASLGALSLFALSRLACTELYFVDDDRIVPATIAPSECEGDFDCVVKPSSMTCCGECEAVPPFEAMPRRELARLRDELETECTPRTRLCDPPVCSPLPAECEARAICVHGACRVVASERCVYR